MSTHELFVSQTHVAGSDLHRHADSFSKLTEHLDRVLDMIKAERAIDTGSFDISKDDTQKKQERNRKRPVGRPPAKNTPEEIRARDLWLSGNFTKLEEVDAVMQWKDPKMTTKIALDRLRNRKNNRQNKKDLDSRQG